MNITAIFQFDYIVQTFTGSIVGELGRPLNAEGRGMTFRCPICPFSVYYKTRTTLNKKLQKYISNREETTTIIQIFCLDI